MLREQLPAQGSCPAQRAYVQVAYRCACAPTSPNTLAGNFTCTDAAELFLLNLTSAPSTKQPPIIIDVSAGAKCRKGDRWARVQE